MNIYNQLLDTLGLSFICLIPIVWIGLFYISTQGRRIGTSWFLSFGLPFFIMIFLAILFVQTERTTQEIISKWGIILLFPSMFLVLLKTLYTKFLLGDFFENKKPRGYIFGILFNVIGLVFLIYLLMKNVPFTYSELFLFVFAIASGIFRDFINFQLREKGISIFFSIYRLNDIKKIQWADKSRIEKISITKLNSEKQIILKIPKDMVYIVDDYIKKHFPAT